MAIGPQFNWIKNKRKIIKDSLFILMFAIFLNILIFFNFGKYSILSNIIFISSIFLIYYSVSDIQEYFSKNESKLKGLISGEKLKGKTGLNADVKTLLKAEFLEQEPKYTTTYRLRVRPINRTEIVYKNIYPTVEEINEYLSIHSIHNDNDNPSNSNRHDLPLKLYPSNPETDDLENDIQY